MSDELLKALNDRSAVYHAIQATRRHPGLSHHLAALDALYEDLSKIIDELLEKSSGHVP